MNAKIDKQQIIFITLIFSFIITVVIFFLGHLSNSDRRFMPETDNSGMYSLGGKVSYGSYKCLFGDFHQIDASGVKAYEFGTKELRFEQLISDTFSHFSSIIIVGIVLTFIISCLWIFNEDSNKFKEIK